MDISDAVVTDYVAFDPSTPVSKLRGAFDRDDGLRVVVIESDDGYEGVVTQKQLLSSHHNPEEKTDSVLRSAPRVSPTEDVRETARLMVESGLKLLPVFEGEELYGVITDRDLLREVKPYLDALDVEDVFTRDLVYVGPDSTIGEVINTIRENGISRVPVVDEDNDAIGLISVYDLVDFTIREMTQEQGGSHEGFDEHGGSGSADNYQTHSGYGERAGVAARMLDLPARDVMSSPVATTEADRPLDEVLETMLEKNYSSLLVSSDDVVWPLGIVTTTDLLRALTWTEETHVPVQVFNVELLDDLTREDIAQRVEEIDSKHEAMDIMEANVVLQRHDEKLRGTSLLQVTIRFFTTDGRYSGTGEGYGARAAFDEAADVIQENVLEKKSREHPSQVAQKGEFDAEKLLGWWLEG